jgi:hypothetical protein
MKFTILTLVLSFSFNVFCQLIGLENLSFKDSNALFFNANYDVHSTSVPNNIYSKIFNGGEITNEDKDLFLKKQVQLNRIGSELKSELIFSNLSSDFFKFKQYSWLYSVSYQSIFTGNYGKDLANLALNGNAQTLGDSLNFGPSRFQQMTYQTFGIGIQDKQTRSYLSLNLVNLQSYFNGQLDGDFFSSADSSSLYLRANGNLSSTHSSRFNKGLGVSVNFVLNIQVPLFVNRNACFQLKISDFGVVRMNSVAQTKMDTAFTFNGFEVNDLLNLQQLSLDQKKWMDTLNIVQDTISKWEMLPVMLQFSKVLLTDSLARYQTFFGIKSYPTLSYFPKIFAGIDYKLKPHFFSGLQLSYGGLGRFRAGLYLRLERERFNLFLGSEDVYGLVSKKGFGQQINLRMICRF